jgi:HSP20 family protein
MKRSTQGLSDCGGRTGNRNRRKTGVVVAVYQSALGGRGSKFLSFSLHHWYIIGQIKKEGIKMPEYRMKVAPDTVAYADSENRKLIVEFAIPGAPSETVDLKMLEDSVHLTAPARDIEYVASLALGWAVKPDKAEANYEHGLLRIEVPFKDPMEDAVKVVVKAGGAEAKKKIIAGK